MIEPVLYAIPVATGFIQVAGYYMMHRRMNGAQKGLQDEQNSVAELWEDENLFKAEVSRALDDIPMNFGQQLMTLGNAMASELEKIPESMAEQLKSMRMSELGQLSGQSRAMKSLDKELALENMGQNFPISAAISQASPEAAKALTKYPFLASFLEGIALKFLPGLMPQQNNGGGAPPNAGPQSGPQTPGKLPSPDDLKKAVGL
jgi:hypothetical protein